MDPSERPYCSQLLKHDFFKKDNFGEKFAQELKAKITRETAENPLLKSINGRHDSKDETAEEKARRKRRKEKVLRIIWLKHCAVVLLCCCSSVSWLVCLTVVRAVWVQVLLRGITFCCVLGQDTVLSQSLSPPRCANGL